MSWKLFLDDERPCPEGYVHAKDVWEMRQLVKEKGFPSHASLDFNLGFDNYDMRPKMSGVVAAGNLMSYYEDLDDNHPVKGKFTFSVHSSDEKMNQVMRKFLAEVGTEIPKEKNLW